MPPLTHPHQRKPIHRFQLTHNISFQMKGLIMFTHHLHVSPQNVLTDSGWHAVHVRSLCLESGLRIRCSKPLTSRKSSSASAREGPLPTVQSTSLVSSPTVRVSDGPGEACTPNSVLRSCRCNETNRCFQHLSDSPRFRSASSALHSAFLKLTWCLLVLDFSVPQALLSILQLLLLCVPLRVPPVLKSGADWAARVPRWPQLPMIARYWGFLAVTIVERHQRLLAVNWQWACGRSGTLLNISMEIRRMTPDKSGANNCVSTNGASASNTLSS